MMPQLHMPVVAALLWCFLALGERCIQGNRVDVAAGWFKAHPPTHLPANRVCRTLPPQSNSQPNACRVFSQHVYKRAERKGTRSLQQTLAPHAAAAAKRLPPLPPPTACRCCHPAAVNRDTGSIGAFCLTTMLISCRCLAWNSGHSCSSGG